MNKLKNAVKNIELPIIIIPTTIVLALFITFMTLPKESTAVVTTIRSILSNEFGIYYLLLGLGVFLLTIGIAFSKFGKIKLGNTEKPLYSNFKWGAMIFTSTLAADVLFYSMSEWAMYANESQLKKWALYKSGRLHIPCFIGVRLRGAFTSFLLLLLDL